MSIQIIEVEGVTVPIEVAREGGDGLYVFKARATTDLLRVVDKEKLGRVLGKAFTEAIETHLKAVN